MNSEIVNFFDNIPTSSDKEIFQTIVENNIVKIERIISYGQTTEKENWYNQTEDEFVLVLEGEAKIQYDDQSIYHLKKGESLYINAHQKHQVIYTANPTIWLAVFITKN